MIQSILDRLKTNGATEHTLKQFLTLGKSTSSVTKLSRKDKKTKAKEARRLLTASQSMTEVGTSTAVVYPGAKSIRQVNNGNRLRINGKVTTMPTIGGAIWDYPLALISKNSSKKKNHISKN